MRQLINIFIAFPLATLYNIEALGADKTVCNFDSVEVVDSLMPTFKKKNRKKSFFKHIGDGLNSFVKAFNDIDTAYIEPQHYNYTVMLQYTSNYELYRLVSKSGQEITFAPNFTLKLGPYVGWRWIFLGYTIDLTAINNKTAKSAKQEFDLSLYSSMLGVDLFWRETGNDYKIRNAVLGKGIDTKRLNGTGFSGLNVSIKGFNLYYIFNHKRFSYPAAFSQSTCQRRSCGSPLLGIGYTHQSLDLDYEKLRNTINDRVGGTEVNLDSGMMFNKIKYIDYSVSGGYAYNWVFAKNWLFAASLSVALSYKKSSGDLKKETPSILGRFNLSNFNIDGLGRFGVVWNDTRWYAGMSTIIHSYNYRRSQLSTNNVFGSLNVYFGWNFGKR